MLKNALKIVKIEPMMVFLQRKSVLMGGKLSVSTTILEILILSSVSFVRFVAGSPKSSAFNSFLLLVASQPSLSVLCQNKGLRQIAK